MVHGLMLPGLIGFRGSVFSCHIDQVVTFSSIVILELVIDIDRPWWNQV
jgi:hypothetical protein